MSEQTEPNPIDTINALAAFTGPSDEVLRAFQDFGQAAIEAFQAMAVALQPVLESFSARYASLSPELQAAISGKPLNRRRVMRRQKLRQYMRTIDKTATT
jgi:hypothetical protein